MGLTCCLNIWIQQRICCSQPPWKICLVIAQQWMCFLSRLSILLIRRWMWSMVTPLQPDVCLLVRAEPPKLILGEFCLIFNVHNAFLNCTEEVVYSNWKVPFHYQWFYTRFYFDSFSNGWALFAPFLDCLCIEIQLTDIHHRYVRQTGLFSSATPSFL